MSGSVSINVCGNSYHALQFIWLQSTFSQLIMRRRGLLSSHMGELTFFGFTLPPSHNSEIWGAPSFLGSLQGFRVRKWYFQRGVGFKPQTSSIRRRYPIHSAKPHGRNLKKKGDNSRKNRYYSRNFLQEYLHVTDNVTASACNGLHVYSCLVDGWLEGAGQVLPLNRKITEQHITSPFEWQQRKFIRLRKTLSCMKIG